MAVNSLVDLIIGCGIPKFYVREGSCLSVHSFMIHRNMEGAAVHTDFRTLVLQYAQVKKWMLANMKTLPNARP